MHMQHVLLNRVSDLVDGGKLLTTANAHAGTMDVQTLTSAHEKQESGSVFGKTVLDGFA